MKELDRFLDSKYAVYAAIALGALCGLAIGISL